jgi:hypothetical protein
MQLTIVLVVVVVVVAVIVAQMMINNCFAEPVGLGECGINKDVNGTEGSYFTARFGIPNKIRIKDNDDNTTTAENGQGQRVKDCRYACQVIANHHGLTAGSSTLLYTRVTGSQLTPSDPNCTENCSAVVPSQMAFIFTEPTTFTIRHRFYILPILEGQNVNMEWNPFPESPGEDQPPQFGTFQITADGVCSLEEWVPVPTSTPSISPQPTTNPTTNPLDSSGSVFGSVMSPLWFTGLLVVLVVGGVAVW